MADRIAVLRDGQLVCDDAIGDYNTEVLVQLMVGRFARIRAGSRSAQYQRAIAAADQGEVFIGDQTKAANISSSKNAIASGITMITEDPQELLFSQSIGVNVTLANLSSVSKFGILDQRAEIEVADDYIKRLRIRSRDCMQAADEHCLAATSRRW